MHNLVKYLFAVTDVAFLYVYEVQVGTFFGRVIHEEEQSLRQRMITMQDEMVLEGTQFHTIQKYV